MLTLPAGAAQVWKMGHIMPAESPVDMAAQKLAELVNERTDGRIKIENFPASQLGSQNDMYELLRMGAMQMMWAGDYVAMRAVPEFEGVHWPYIFKDHRLCDPQCSSPNDKQARLQCQGCQGHEAAQL